jgi:hypothetical protein
MIVARFFNFANLWRRVVHVALTLPRFQRIGRVGQQFLRKDLAR